MYKALNYWVYGGFGPAKTPKQFIDFAAKRGLDGVELTVGDCIPLDIEEPECWQIKAYAASRNIGLRTLASGMGWSKWLCSPDKKERTEAIENTKKYLQIAAWLGAETVLVVPGATRVHDGSRPSIRYDVAWKNATASLKELEKSAAKLKVNIGVENVWNNFLLSPMEWKFFLDQFKTGRVGIYLDIANCQLYAKAQDYIELLEKRVKAVHVKNWKGANWGGDLLGFGEKILDGDVDVKATVKALQRKLSKIPLTAEMIPFSRGAKLNIPDEKLALATIKALKSI